MPSTYDSTLPNASVQGEQGLSMAVATPAPRDIWQELLTADPDALPYQSPAWLDSVCASGRYVDASRLYQFPGGLRAVMPIVRRRGLPRRLASESSLPDGWGIGGVVASAPIGTAELSTIFADLSAHSALSVRLRPNPRRGRLWAAARPPDVLAIPRNAHVLDLDGGFDQVWTHRFKADTRNRVRRAERSGLVVECDTSGRLIPTFYQLLLQSFDRWAGAQHEPRALAQWRGRRRDPIEKFQCIAHHLGQQCRIWVAWLDGKPAATLLVLVDRNANYSRGAMDPDLAGPTHANYLLQSRAIEDACQAGCRFYHMGETGHSDGLARFKTRFGATPYPYAEYFIEKVPIKRTDIAIRRVVKKLIGFKD